MIRYVKWIIIMKMISAPSIKLSGNTSEKEIQDYVDHFPKNDGYCELQTADGKKLMVFHGSHDGSIYIPIELAMTADIIICCHPKVVIAKHPELKDKVYKPIRGQNAIITSQIVGRGIKAKMNIWAKWK